MSLENTDRMFETDLLALADARIQVDPLQWRTYVDGKQSSAITPHQSRILGALALKPDYYHTVPELTNEVYGYTDARSCVSMQAHVSGTKKVLSRDHRIDGSSVIQIRRGYGYSGTSSLLRPVTPVVDGMGIIYPFASNRISVNGQTHLVSVDEKTMALPPIQFGIITDLAAHVGKPVASEGLIASNSIAPGNSLLVTMGNIRKALGFELGHPKTGAIITIPRFGFMAIEHY